jgi:hypothetical protein
MNGVLYRQSVFSLTIVLLSVPTTNHCMLHTLALPSAHIHNYKFSLYL